MASRIYSDSILEAFAACIARGHDALGRRHGKAGPAKVGQALHALLERYVVHLFRNGILSDKEWLTTTARSMKWQLTPDDEADVMRVVEKLGDADLPWILEAKEEPIVEVRQWFTLDGREVPPERVRDLDQPVFAMTADVRYRHAVDGMLRVVDWKSGHVIEHLEAPDRRRQMRRYAAAVSGCREPVLVGTWHVRHNWMEWAAEPYTTTELDEAWQDLVVAPIKAIEAMVAAGKTLDERTVGAHCGWCDLRNGCDAFRRFPTEPMENCAACEGKGWLDAEKKPDGFVTRVDCGECGGSGRVLIDDDRLVLMLAVAQAKERDLALVVRSRVADHGPIAADGYEAKVSATASWEWSDPLAVREVLSKHVAPEYIEQAFRASKTSIERAMKDAGLKPKQREAAFTDLFAVGKPTYSSTVRVGKAEHKRLAGGEEG
jgi:hypothetical protein